jgi:transcriptional regulator with XRE-family HTH domain
MSPSPDEHPVRIARKAKDWRLEDLAAKAGCSKPLLSNVEHGFCPSIRRMREIAKALDTTPEVLWPQEFPA